jgi:hypothetical protein
MNSQRAACRTHGIFVEPISLKPGFTRVANAPGFAISRFNGFRAKAKKPLKRLRI